MFSSRVDNFKKTIKGFLKTKMSIQSHLNKLAYIILSFQQKHHQALSYILTQTMSSLNIFKILILIHHCLNTQIRLQYEEIISLLGNMKQNSKGPFQKYLQQQVNSQYTKYLQKRLYHEILKKQGRKESEKEKELEEQLFITKSYQYLNLLRLGLSFSRTIYTFGRYYIRQYGFFPQFNRVLGSDFQQIYHQLKENLKHIPKNAQQYFLILNQVECINENMYVVYFNCYFNQYISKYIPQWIQTDVEELNRSCKFSKNSSSTLYSSKNTSPSVKSKYTETDLESEELENTVVQEKRKKILEQRELQKTLKQLIGQQLEQFQ